MDARAPGGLTRNPRRLVVYFRHTEGVETARLRRACACALAGRSVMRGRGKRMASELRAARDQRRPTRPRRAGLHGRPRWARVTLRVLRALCALLVVSVITTAAAFAYLYSHYSKIVDE